MASCITNFGGFPCCKSGVRQTVSRGTFILKLSAVGPHEFRGAATLTPRRSMAPSKRILSIDDQGVILFHARHNS